MWTKREMLRAIQRQKATWSHLRLVEPDCHLPPPPPASDCCIHVNGTNMLLLISSPFCPLCSVYMMFPYAVVLVFLKVRYTDIRFGNFARNADWDPVTVPGELPAPAL